MKQVWIWEKCEDLMPTWVHEWFMKNTVAISQNYLIDRGYMYMPYPVAFVETDEGFICLLPGSELETFAALLARS